ncbi:unnamed protein product [Calypogeia fissa]
METKQERLLSRVIVNHLFLSQFEPLRALLRTLYDINPTTAFGILKTVIKAGGRVDGVLWSHSVPSPSHLAWLCLGELTALQSDRGYSYREERALWISDPRVIFDNVEFLLFVELLEKLWTTEARKIAHDSGDELWDAGRNAFRNFSKNVSERFAASSSVVPGQTSKGKGLSVGSKVSQNFQVTGKRGFDGTAVQGEAQQEDGTRGDGTSQEAAGSLGEEPPTAAEETEIAEFEELRNAGVEFFQKLSAAGLDRLIERLTSLDVGALPPGSEREVKNDSEIDGIEHAGEASQSREADPGTKAEPRARSDVVIDETQPGLVLADKHKTLIKKLTLYHPDLLHSFSTNIRRQHYLRRPVSRSDPRRRDEETSNRFSFETEPGELADESRPSDRPRDSDENVEEKIFELGKLLLNEIQSAHLEEMEKDIVEGKLAKAIQHLRYLHGGTEIPDAQYSKVIRMVIDGTKKNLDPRRSPRDRRDDTSIYKAYEQVIAAGSPLLASMAESIQDDLILEAVQAAKAADVDALPPPLEKLHRRLETRRSVASTSNVSVDSLWIRTCKMELFQYARVTGVHVLETVMKAAFSSIRALQFQKAADVLIVYPRLQPLATVMGWDLLAGKTSARRRLMELLWAGRPKSGRLDEGSTSGRPMEEVSCIDELCDKLCYHLELAYYAALVNSGGNWQADASKIFGSSRVQVDRDHDDQPPAETFVANLVLERLAMHSPLRVIFDLVPRIKVQDALQLIDMQPAGTSPANFFQRQQDLELLHLNFGVQVMVRALVLLEASALEDQKYQVLKQAKSLLLELRQHLDSVTTPVRKIWMMRTIVHLLHMDKLSISKEELGQSEDSDVSGGSPNVIVEGDTPTAVAFLSDILILLRQSLSSLGDGQGRGKQEQGEGQTRLTIVDVPESVSKTGEQKAVSVEDFVEDWEWRLVVLQHLRPSSQHQWQWKEALSVLRASPSTLLTMCIQHGQFGLGEEAVRRYDLSPEEAATLQLAEWVDRSPTRSSADDAGPHVAEGTSPSDESWNPFGLSAPLPPLANVILFLDVAAASAKSVTKARQLLDQTRVLLSQISQAGSKRQSTTLIEQKQEAALILLTKRVLQRFQDLLEQDRSRALQTTFSGADIVSSGIDVVRQGPKQRALGILHQIIEDAHNGKRQFLSGKLHNLVKALSDEDDDSGSKQVSSYSDRKQIALEHGLVLGLGFQASPQPLPRSSSGDHGEVNQMATKSAGKRFLGPLSNKPTAYLSAFILYIATVGDIVDGADTTHDFNFFSLIYERPNDLLTRLVFERGNADAAGKVAEIMGEDLVHQVITACVPPVYPPKGGKGWACIPRLPSRDVQSTGVLHNSPIPASNLRDDKAELYVLRRDVVKHLATLSPVRAVLACVFGGSRFTVHVREGEADSTSLSQQSQQQLDDDQWFYEFALEQSERYSTLHRWIQIQANLQRLSESPISTKRLNGDEGKVRRARKRMRDPEEEAKSDDEPETQENLVSPPSAGLEGSQRSTKSSLKTEFKTPEESVPFSILLDWENEGPYDEAVKGLIEEGKLVDALALADRYLGAGAPDQLLQLLIERGEDSGAHSGSQWQGHGNSHHSLSNSSWQYCIRLRNKRLAATLALKYFHRWELDAAIDVLTMCICHLDRTEPLYEEVLRVKSSLQQYGRILRADSRFSNWREVEALCQSDPEGLALRLASKGAVSAALSVAESFNLPNVTRRELQGRQLVQLLTSDPTTGGGPAEGLRFLKSLQNSEDALPVAMAAMEQLPNLQAKQLLVHFFLKGRVGQLSEDEHARLDRLALGLRMLGALPLPWQQRCSALHEHPRLILETLLMWKQLKAASQLLRAFPSLRDNELIISYAAKAITFSAGPSAERRTHAPSPASKPPPRVKSNFTSGLTSLQREARRAFSWTSRETSSKNVPKDPPSRKQKGSLLPPSQIAAWEAMAGIPEERPAVGLVPQEGHERPAPVTMGDEWVLTGDSTKDDAVRSSHRYESSPSAILFKALLSLCSDEAVAAKAAVDLCSAQIQKLLCAEQLPLDASSEVIERAFHATEAFVQALLHARTQLRSIVGQPPTSVTSETVELSSGQGSAMFQKTPPTESLPELLTVADMWLSRMELLQSLLGAGVTASLDDLLDEGSTMKLRDRLIDGERYSMAVYTCTKCKIDALPVWDAWGHALLRIEHYAQARVKFKQALGLLKGDPAPFVRLIIQTMESGAPADVTAVRNLYLHMAKSFATSTDDSLSTESYLNILYMPSFTKSDRSRRSSEDSADSFAMNAALLNGEESIRSNLDGVRYEECVYYLQEYSRQDLLAFTFQHGRYYDGCLLFFPSDSVPPPPIPSPYQTQVVSSSPQRPDSLATDYGSIDDLCEYCVSYGAIPVLERVLSARSNNQDSAVSQHTAAALTRICNYCEVHRHFNHLYRFQVLKKDYVAAGLCCIQLFLNSSQHDQALRHLERAKAHFDEGLVARQQAGDVSKGVAKVSRGKLPSDKLTEEELIKFTARINIQMEVVRTFTEADGALWKRSLFGNPNDADTFKRRCDVAEDLIERNFDLAFQIIYDFGLPAVHIYAGVAASLALRRKSRELTDLLRNIKGTIDVDDRDQVLGAAINVYANKHRERPDRLIEMLSSSHRKVLACVVCGRLKTAFQIASKNNSVTDVQYVAHQARISGTKSVLDLCKQWLAKNS